MIERAIGRGASASVYAAHDTKQDRRIALKVLSHAIGDALGSKRFVQEIRITSRLQHPHILPIYDWGEWKGLLYYVLPFIAGESLREKLSREKQLPIEECVQLTCDVASALAHAHSQGVIHRDVKPENILLSEGHALVADFGIARTIDIHTGERLTSSGLIVGTSQYMSPEQASGEREIDARSDIYSLGCVLYEMLAGIEPFVGPNVQAVIAQRFTHTPPPIKTYRPVVPDYLVSVLERALAVSPADRFQTMKEFEAALPATNASPSERRRPGRSVRDLLRTTKGKILLVAATAFIAALVAAVIPGSRGFVSFLGKNPQLDTTLYAVLPPSDSAGVVSLASSESGEILHDALAGWKGINLVQKVRIQNALKRYGSPTDLEDAKKFAISFGAGKLVWGKIVGDGQLAHRRYQFWLVDVPNDSVREVTVPADSARAGATIALSLLRDPVWPATAAGSEWHTRSYPALQAYGRAHAALSRWDIANASALFATAAKSDPEFVEARFWNAQVQSWTKSSDWGRDAAFAASKSASLKPREAALARALGSMANKDYPLACTEYRAVLALDSMDHLGWRGLGECLRSDDAVLPSKTSPSGLRFRSSFRGAARAFMRAVELEPGAHAIVDFSHMQLLLAISPNRVRRGKDSAGVWAFAAFPSLESDTLAYIPYPLKVFAALPFTAIHGRDEALERNARELEQFANSWIAANPKNPDAYEALATVLEAQGNISPRISGRRSASEALATAVSLTTNPAQRTRLSATEVRLRIKRGEFAAANRLADSLLSVAAARDSDEMTAISGFVGRTRTFSRFAQRYDGWLPTAISTYNVPADLRVNMSDLFARAALGECGNDIAELQQQLDHNIESYITPEKREGLHHILTARTFSLLTPCTRGQSALQIKRVENRLQRAQQAFGRNNSVLTRSILDSLAMGRINTRPGDLSLDFYFQEAWLRANIGDSLIAIKQLDRALNALGAMSAGAMREPGAAGALGRAMILRAELAAKTGDAEMAERWTRAIDSLYAGADPPLRKIVDALKVLVSRSRKH